MWLFFFLAAGTDGESSATSGAGEMKEEEGGGMKEKEQVASSDGRPVSHSEQSPFSEYWFATCSAF